MDSNIRSEPQPKFPRPSYTINIWKIAFFVFLGLFFIGLFFISNAFWYYRISKKSAEKLNSINSNSKKEGAKTLISPYVNKLEDKEELLTVNYSNSSIGGEQASYLTFQLKFPSKYYVTSGNMVTSYLNQGGSSPPILIFTKETQPLDGETYQDIWEKGKDCIFVWSSLYINSIEDFQTRGGSIEPPKTIAQEKITILNSYQADKRIVKYPNRTSENVEVFVKLPQDVSYFFQTCNLNSEKDLEIMLKHFKLRAFDLRD